MGRWDKFDKGFDNGFDKGGNSKREPFKSDLTKEDIQKIRAHCIGMTESEKDKVVSEIVHTYEYIQKMLDKVDSSPPDHSQVEAMVCMMYGAYEELCSPPAMLVVACKIAQHQNFTPSTMKEMLKCLSKMMEGRFEKPSWGSRSDSGEFKSGFKFE